MPRPQHLEPVLRNRYPLLIVLLCALWLHACGDDSEEANPSETTSGESSTAGATSGQSSGGTSTTSQTTPSVEPIGACNYTNSFSQGQDCKLYTGSGWTVESATEDCANVLGGESGVFVAGERCAADPVLGVCTVEGDNDDGFTLYSLGEDSGQCAGTQVGCEVFLGGAFEQGFICDGSSGSVTGDVFTQPYQTCTSPMDGEPAGQGPNGQVCTQNSIQGATEEGRYYPDYGSCEDVLSQRPYYEAPLVPNTASDDPRLQDVGYMGEFAWVNEQIRATACTCCHASSATPAGASTWDIEAPGLWVDTLSENGLAMMAGVADSETFGAFDPEDNNGFDRSVTGVPTTDVERMRAFFLGELTRRNPDYASVDYTAFGGPLYDQSVYEPGPCEDGVGVTAEGEVVWTGPTARYVYVLEANADNPGVPPNKDLPEGTLWRLDVDAEADPVGSGLTYGAALEGTVQRFPEAGEAPTLEDGASYLLYVLLDVAVPVERCVFTYTAE